MRAELMLVAIELGSWWWRSSNCMGSRPQQIVMAQQIEKMAPQYYW